MPKREPNYHGILVVDKPGRAQIEIHSDRPECSQGEDAAASDAKQPKLPTSHDVVQMARRWCKQRRIGHTGTLDPMASGLLVLCLGSATRLVEYYQNHAKQYYAEISLGIETDTYDAVGQVVASSPVPELNIADIEAVLAGFRGEILQMPPLFSAIKQGGESLHRKVRRGEEVTVQPRSVTFHQLELVNFAAPDRLCLRVVCSAGTYIRSLAYDLGRALGTHGHLDVLRREAAGSFTLNDAHTPAEIDKAVQDERLDDLILASGYGLTLPTIELEPDEMRRFGFGQSVNLPMSRIQQSSTESQVGPMVGPEVGPEVGPSGVQMALGGIVAAYDHSVGTFAGIIKLISQTDTTVEPSYSDNQAHSNADSAWKAEKWFAKT